MSNTNTTMARNKGNNFVLTQVVSGRISGKCHCCTMALCQGDDSCRVWPRSTAWRCVHGPHISSSNSQAATRSQRKRAASHNGRTSPPPKMPRTGRAPGRPAKKETVQVVPSLEHMPLPWTPATTLWEWNGTPPQATLSGSGMARRLRRLWPLSPARFVLLSLGPSFRSGVPP